jgi:FlaA1/EpsC-like NDP-sugar epimerase
VNPSEAAGSTSKLYIIGAGFAGRSLAREIRRKNIYGEVAAFLDDDPVKIGTQVEGSPVLGPINDVARLLQPRSTDRAIIAMPSVSRERLREIFLMLKQREFSSIKILPDMGQVIEGSAHLVQTREIDPQDLLLRKPVKIGLKESISYLRGKRVLITGAGGSIGSELSRQLLYGGASRLYLFGHGENSIYEIDRELRLLQQEGVGEKAIIVPIIGELQDPDYMEFILPRLRPDVIFHTAAYKHVPMMEHNPVMAVKNNVFGTRNILSGMRSLSGSRLVLISTDKVVEPRSVYGASKRLAEELVLAETHPENAYMVVRFGNVLGSRGSIVPLFKQQILNGGPVTLTHPEMRRFFMTIPEAASLVLKAGGVGASGTLYTLEMGQPVVIRELAEQMIRFYGLEPDRDILLEFIGVRPGEKLEESLHADGEITAATDYPGIRRIVEKPADVDISAAAAELEPVCYLTPGQEGSYRNRRVLRDIMTRHLPSLERDVDEPEY